MIKHLDAILIIIAQLTGLESSTRCSPWPASSWRSTFLLELLDKLIYPIIGRTR